jgi:ribonuclease HI
VNIVYTDGSFSPETGVGAWAWVQVGDSGIVKTDRGGVYEGRSSYAMEAKAILEAVVAFPQDPLLIYTDHAGLVTQLSVHPNNLRLWVMGARRGRQNTGGALPYLVSLEERLRGRSVTLRHVKGHSGDEFNRKADQLCFASRKSLEKAMRGNLGNVVSSHAEVLGGWSYE